MNPAALQTLSPLTRRLLPLLWTLAVLPFLTLGYGGDDDAWRVAEAARKIWETGHYVSSRTTGFPLLEILAAPLIHFGQWYLSNLIGWAGGLFLLLGFVKLAEQEALQHPLWTVVLLAFHPLILKNGSSTMDYLPALALLLWGYIYLMQGRWGVYGVLVGLACGFRPSSGLFVLAGMYAHWRAGGRIKQIGAIYLTALGVGALAFSPSLLTYGIPTSVEPMAFPPRLVLLMGGYNFLTFLGVLGSLLVWPLLAWRWGECALRGIPAGLKPFYGYHAVTLLVGFLLYAKMPLEPEYLLPVLPSVILLLDRLLSRKELMLVAAVLLSYHVVHVETLGGESGARRIALGLGSGYTPRDVRERLFYLSTRELADNLRVDRPTVLFFGDAWIPANNPKWQRDEATGGFRQKDGQFIIAQPILNREALAKLHAQNYRLILWKGRKFEFTYSGLSGWEHYVEVVDSLEEVLGGPILGRPRQ
ncbi:MAG: hypothetical protein HQL56_04215 [Magnetococcales bacterium]|nr:hypothetical protein [Magnetococcales bacterium]